MIWKVAYNYTNDQEQECWGFTKVETNTSWQAYNIALNELWLFENVRIVNVVPVDKWDK